MILKIVISFLLALSATNAVAGNMYIYKDKNGKVLHTNVNPSGNVDKFSKEVKVTYYRDSDKKNISPLPQKTSLSEKEKRSKDTYIQVVQPSKSEAADSMFEVPEGYRLPTKADITGDWKQFDAPNHIKADFNGDGIEDEAYILPKKGSIAGYGVFVSINNSKVALQRGRKFQMFKLTDSDDMSPQSFAIELAEPSDVIWKSACGKGYWKCAIGEPTAFQIKNPSIMFCYIESACTMYMWDSDKLTFKEIRFSD